MKKIIALVLSLIVVLTAFAACGKKDKAATVAQINVGVQEIPSADYLARAGGFIQDAFQEKGITVNFVTFSSGAKVNAALASGDIDFGYIGSCPVANALASGIDIEAIYIHGVVGAGESLAVKKSSGITSAEGLKGKTVATPFASTAHYSLLNAIKNSGLAQTDVTILDMQPADILAAWNRGDIDAAYVWEPTLSELVSSDGIIILDSSDVAQMGYMTCDIEVANKAFAAANPELVKLYVSALEQATELFLADTDKAATLVAAELGVSKQSALAQMNGYVWENSATQYEKYYATGALAETLKNTADFLKAQGSVASVPSADTFKTACNDIYVKAAAGIE